MLRFHYAISNLNNFLATNVSTAEVGDVKYFYQYLKRKIMVSLKLMNVETCRRSNKFGANFRK